MILITKEEVRARCGGTLPNWGFDWSDLSYFLQTGGVDEPVRLYPYLEGHVVRNGPCIETSPADVFVTQKKGP